MTDNKLDFWIRNNYNVLIKGLHGTGKTTRVISAFERNNLKWKYFSTSTLDPWVDFVGVPKEVKDENGNSYLDLIRPKHFANDEVEAIFLDEYNRSSQKVRNATMELIQFKSINGKKFKNLRFVWAAINPDKDESDEDSQEYDVDKLDPAQQDRFEIHVEVPYKPDLTYFKNKYGSDVAGAAVDWWNDLSLKESLGVSPRRLDYALDVYIKNGDLRDVLPAKSINVSKLITELGNGSFRRKLNEIFKTKDVPAASEFINDENSYTNTIKYILSDRELLEFFVPLIPEEKQCLLISTNDKVLKFALKKFEAFQDIIKRVANRNPNVHKEMIKYIKSLPMDPADFNKFTFSGPKVGFSKKPKRLNVSHYSDMISAINESMKEIDNGTEYRKGICKIIAHYMFYEKGYERPVASNTKFIRLTINEIEVSLNALNSIIERTTSFTSFENLASVYGILCKELSTVYGKKQNYSIMSRKALAFLDSNGDKFI